MRANPVSGLRSATLPPFPSSQHDVMAMHALDCVCSEGLVRAGVAMAAVVCECGKVAMATVPDSRRRRFAHEVRLAVSREGSTIAAIGFAELVSRDGVPHHSMHVENDMVCAHLERCAFIGEDGNPVSSGGVGITHLSAYTIAPDGLAFWPRPKGSPRQRVHPDTHTLIDKPKRRSRKV